MHTLDLMAEFVWLTLFIVLAVAAATWVIMRAHAVRKRTPRDRLPDDGSKGYHLHS